MKSCAVVPARDLSKVMTTAPASPVPASNRSFPASSVSRNWGEFGLKKLLGCGSKVSAKAGLPWARPIVSAASITARWPRWTPSKLPIATTIPLGIAAWGVESRITIKSDGMGWGLQLWPDAGGTVTWPPPPSQAERSRLTGCLRADATGWGEVTGLLRSRAVSRLVRVSVLGVQDGG